MPQSPPDRSAALASDATAGESRGWLLHVVLPIGGSLVLHVALATIVVLASWTVLVQREAAAPEYEVDIVNGPGSSPEGSYDWNNSLASAVVNPDLPKQSETWDFDKPPDLSALGSPQAEPAERHDASGGFGIGDSGRSGVLGVGGGAGAGGGGGFGEGFGGNTSLGTAGVWQLSARGDEFAYVVDFSGSIVVAVEDLKRELKRSIGGLQPSQSFDVFVFYSEATANKEQFITEPFAPKLVPATASNKRGFFSWIEAKRPHGRTEPLGAIKRALAQQPDVIFFFSDGLFGDEVVDQIAAANTGGTRIYCLVFDEVLLQDTSELPRWTQGARRLKRIAEASGGQAKVVTGADLGD